MKLIVNPEACVGCGACTNIAEDLFEINEDNVSTPKNEGVVPEDKEELARDAIDSCPTGAIADAEEEELAQAA